MNKVIGYTRVSTQDQTNDNQKHKILDYAHKNKIIVDEIIEVKISSRKKKEDRKIDELLNQLDNGDTLLVSALDRLGRSTIETLEIIEEIKNKGIILIFVTDNITIDPNNENPINTMMLTMLSGFAQMERSFISQRVKAGLEARKAAGVTLGRKKGSQGVTAFDEYREKIQELYSLGLSMRKIINIIGIDKSHVSLANFIKTRGIIR